MKMLGGAPKYFLALTGGGGGGGSETSRYTEGGGGYKLFKVLVKQGPGVFTPNHSK